MFLIAHRPTIPLHCFVLVYVSNCRRVALTLFLRGRTFTTRPLCSLNMRGRQKEVGNKCSSAPSCFMHTCLLLLSSSSNIQKMEVKLFICFRLENSELEGLGFWPNSPTINMLINCNNFMCVLQRMCYFQHFSVGIVPHIHSVVTYLKYSSSNLHYCNIL